jgi:hypothetical protein
MAKFIKFKVANGNAPGAGGDYSRDVLVNVDDIENVADVVAGGVYSVIVTLKGLVGVTAAGGGQAAYTVPAFVEGLENFSGDQAAYTVPAIPADAVGTVGGRIITLIVSTSPTAAVNPAAITVAQNMPSQSIVRALTANPGGVAASAQLSRDGAGLAANAQMFWASAAFTSDVTL